MRHYTALEARRRIAELENLVAEWKEAYVNQVHETEALRREIQTLKLERLTQWKVNDEGDKRNG